MGVLPSSNFPFFTLTAPQCNKLGLKFEFEWRIFFFSLSLSLSQWDQNGIRKMTLTAPFHLMTDTWMSPLPNTVCHGASGSSGGFTQILSPLRISMGRRGNALSEYDIGKHSETCRMSERQCFLAAWRMCGFTVWFCSFENLKKKKRYVLEGKLPSKPFIVLTPSNATSSSTHRQSLLH